MASPVGDSYGCASGGVIAAGRRRFGALGDFVAGMAPGTWAQYTGVDINATETAGPSGTARSWLEGEANYPLTNWPGKIAFDPDKKLLIAIGTTNGYVSEIPAGAHSKNLIFDLFTNEFSAAWNPVGRSYGHFYDTNSSRALNGYFYSRGYSDSSIRKMSTTTRMWSESYSLTGLVPAAGSVGAVEVHPSLGSTGSVLFLEPTGRLVRFNTADGIRSIIGTYAGIGSYPVMHYVPALDCVIFGGGESGSKLYKLTDTGEVLEVTTTLPVTLAANGTGGPFVPDPSGLPRSWHFYDGDSTVRYIDWTTGQWTTFGAPPAALSGRFDVTVAASLTGMSAFALLTYGGRSGGVTTSKFWILKV